MNLVVCVKELSDLGTVEPILSISIITSVTFDLNARVPEGESVQFDWREKTLKESSPGDEHWLVI